MLPTEKQLQCYQVKFEIWESGLFDLTCGMTSSNGLQKPAIATEISILLFAQLKCVDETSVLCLCLFWSPLAVLYKMFLNVTRPCLHCGKQLGLMNGRCKGFSDPDRFMERNRDYQLSYEDHCMYIMTTDVSRQI